jgi:hypothetical protein
MLLLLLLLLPVAPPTAPALRATQPAATAWRYRLPVCACRSLPGCQRWMLLPSSLPFAWGSQPSWGAMHWLSGTCRQAR